MTVTRQRADYWQERGAADAVLRLYASGRIRPLVTYREAARIAGISTEAAIDAFRRARHNAVGPRSQRRRMAPSGPAPTGTKWCGQCQEFRPLNDFSPNRSSTTGYQSWCRACMVYARRAQRERARRRSAA